MPEQKKPVTLDLDALEREDSPGLFTVRVSGEEFTFADPHEMDWRELNDMSMAGDEVAVMQRLLGDQFKRFARHTVPAWKKAKLVRAWREHYGLPNRGESLASSD